MENEIVKIMNEVGTRVSLDDECIISGSGVFDLLVFNDKQIDKLSEKLESYHKENMREVLIQYDKWLIGDADEFTIDNVDNFLKEREG